MNAETRLTLCILAMMLLVGCMKNYPFVAKRHPIHGAKSYTAYCPETKPGNMLLIVWLAAPMPTEVTSQTTTTSYAKACDVIVPDVPLPEPEELQR